MQYFTLNNGVKCPVFGIGTYLLSPEEAYTSVRAALEAGCRLVDTANMYANERAVGRAIRDSGIPREEIFLSTKFWPTEYQNPKAMEETLERLDTDYVDLLYLHQPSGAYLDGWKLVEEAYKKGQTRSMGLSNFDENFFEEMKEVWTIPPQFIQAEGHPYDARDELRAQMAPYDMTLMTWFPLGHGMKELLEEAVLRALAEKYGKTVPQIILRWHVQMGFVPIPGSTNVDHVRENCAILDFSLSEADMADIAELNTAARIHPTPPERIAQYAEIIPVYEEKQ